MELDRQFHTKIAEISGNSQIADFLRSVHECMSRIWFLPLWQFHDFGLTGDEHASILAAMRERDSKAADDAMRAISRACVSGLCPPSSKAVIISREARPVYKKPDGRSSA